jgi:hypothetical protein
MSTPFQNDFRGMPQADLSLTNLKVNSSTAVDNLLVRSINNIPFADILSMIDSNVSNDVKLDLSKYNLVFTSPTSLLQTAIDEAYALVLSTSRGAVVCASPGVYTDTTLTLRNGVSIISFAQYAVLPNLTSVFANGYHYFRNIFMESKTNISCSSSLTSQVSLLFENSTFTCSSTPSVIDTGNGRLVIQLNNSTFGTSNPSQKSIILGPGGSSSTLSLNVFNNSVFRGIIEILSELNHSIRGQYSEFLGAVNFNGNFLQTGVLTSNPDISFNNCRFEGGISSNKFIKVNECRLTSFGIPSDTQVYSALTDGKCNAGDCLKVSSSSTNPTEVKLTQTTQPTDTVIGVAQTSVNDASGGLVLVADGSTLMKINTTIFYPVESALEPSTTPGQATSSGTLKTLATFAVLVNSVFAMYSK